MVMQTMKADYGAACRAYVLGELEAGKRSFRRTGDWQHDSKVLTGLNAVLEDLRTDVYRRRFETFGRTHAWDVRDVLQLQERPLTSEQHAAANHEAHTEAERTYDSYEFDGNGGTVDVVGAQIAAMRDQFLQGVDPYRGV